MTNVWIQAFLLCAFYGAAAVTLTCFVLWWMDGEADAEWTDECGEDDAE